MEIREWVVSCNLFTGWVKTDGDTITAIFPMMHRWKGQSFSRFISYYSQRNYVLVQEIKKMNKDLKKKLKEEHRCVHCQDPLPEEYTQESCMRCKKVLKKAAADGGWRWKMTVQILDAYGWRCECCGEKEPMFLTIDHIEGGGNLHREEVREHRNDWYKYLIENDFPTGFRTLCYNCNLGRSRNGGICPHQEN